MSAVSSLPAFSSFANVLELVFSCFAPAREEGVSPMPKDGGAEQGDVDGPLECSLALRMVAAEARGSTAAR